MENNLLTVYEIEVKNEKIEFLCDHSKEEYFDSLFKNIEKPQGQKQSVRYHSYSANFNSSKLKDHLPLDLWKYTTNDLLSEYFSKNKFIKTF